MRKKTTHLPSHICLPCDFFTHCTKLRMWTVWTNNSAETGVWRGGSSIVARAVLAAYGATDRISYVCDSFAGLPPGDRSLHIKDLNWDNTPYLEVSR